MGRKRRKEALRAMAQNDGEPPALSFSLSPCVSARVRGCVRAHLHLCGPKSWVAAQDKNQ